MLDKRTHIQYLDDEILPGLRVAFARGEATYVGKENWQDHHCTDRTASEDIHHVRELHVEVRIREAEELADNGKLQEARKKIESAIGYLVILHRRLDM